MKLDRKANGYKRVSECLYRNNASGIYYALFKYRGKQIRRSLKTRERPFANRAMLNMRTNISLLKTGICTARLRFREVAESWYNLSHGHLKGNSSRRLEGVVRRLSGFFGSDIVRNISFSRCEEWAEQRGNEVAAATFNLERNTLFRVMRYAKREGIVLENPAEAIVRRHQQKPLVSVPSRKQFSMLVATLRSMGARVRPAAALVELLAYSGMRKGEAVAFRMSDVDFERGTFTVTGGRDGTKSRESRAVPLFPVLQAFLERTKRDDPSNPEKPLIRIQDAKRSLKSACKLNCIPHFTHHSMRHYFVSNALEVGVNTETIAAWIGHNDGGALVAKTYGHLRGTHSFEMAKRMTS